MTASAPDPVRGRRSAITYVPTYGGTNNLGGLVANVNPAAYHVATYLFLEGVGGWTKPYVASPCTTINADRTFTVDVTTGGCDAYANRYAVYLLAAIL